MTSWTSDMDAIMVANWKDRSATQIADLIGGGITKNAVIGRGHRLQLPKKIWRAPCPVLSRERMVRLKPVKAPPTQPAAICAPTKPVPFMELAAWHCREVIGTGKDGLSLSCGQLQVPGLSYCPEHRRKNFDGIRR